MKFPANLDPAGFLAGHWQKAPLFLPSGISPLQPALSPDELAWLATLPDVESRLIRTHESGGTCTYSVEHGPFDDDVLMRLPDSNWTLLVQDVEKHLPDFRVLFEHVDFIPDWRIDDVMVSFAAPGGGVGPHLDQYDVFLCQGAGQRLWKLTTSEKTQASNACAELSLLRPYVAESQYVAEDGDVLYLPPGAPHWGIAQGACMTCSIGMRAPQLSEFLATYQQLFGRKRALPSSTRGPATYYSDPDLAPDEARPGLIGERALQRMFSCWDLENAAGREDLIAAFGCMVTRPKAWLAPERLSASECRRVMSAGHGPLPVHGMARVAYTAGGPLSGRRVRVFANGLQREVDAPLGEQVAGLCRQRQLQAADLDHWRTEGPLKELLGWLLAGGVFDVDEQ